MKKIKVPEWVRTAGKYVKAVASGPMAVVKAKFRKR